MLCIYVNVINMLSTSKDSDFKEENRTLKIVERPTFILKTREGESRAISPSQRNGNKYISFLTNIIYIF